MIIESLFAIGLMLAESRMEQQAVSAPDSRVLTAAADPEPSPVCSFDENGEPTCYPIDQADKFRR